MVLISNCGFPERHHFSALVETFRLFTSIPDMDLSATILCTGGELLSVPALREGIRWYWEAARATGREFVKSGAIASETQEVLDRNLADPEQYSSMSNAYWDSVIVKPSSNVAGR